MQICHSLRSKQIDMSMADRLISIFRNNAGTPVSTLRSNAATLKYTFPRGGSKIETWQRFKQNKYRSKV